MADDITRSPEEGGRIVDEPIGEALSKRVAAVIAVSLAVGAAVWVFS